MKISYLPISAQLRIGFCTLLGAMILVAVLAVFQLSRANTLMRQVVDINVQKIELLFGMADSAHQVSRIIRTVALIQEETERNSLREKMFDANAGFDVNFAKLKKLPLDSTGKSLVAELDKQAALLNTLNWQFLELSDSDNTAATEFLLTTVRPSQVKLHGILDQFMDVQKRKNKIGMLEAEAKYSNSIAVMISLSIAAIVLSLGLAHFIGRSISSSIAEAASFAGLVQAGDLTRRATIDVRNRSENALLLSTLNKMGIALNGVVTKVRQFTNTLQLRSSRISQDNQDLSQRTIQQAAALEETAAAMEELATSVKQNADNAEAASTKANATAEIAQNGGAAMHRVVERMNAIESSAQRIVEIISVINSIAFQTNILALNAAVEAARAGEQGRGFAVVASEVRNLAQRSAAAATEIAHLINASVSEVQAGSTLVRTAGHTMEQVVASVSEVSHLIATIATATREQSLGIEQTYNAVSEMEQITQQNAQLVDELGKTAMALDDEATQLGGLVSRFKVLADDTDEAAFEIEMIATEEPWSKRLLASVTAPQAQLA